MTRFRIACFLAILLATPQADAALVHRYSFNGNVNDSVGGAHGVIVDAGSTPSATFANGQLTLMTEFLQPGANIPEGAYVDLPNGLVSSAANGGVANELTIEMWAQAGINWQWAPLFTAGGLHVGDGEGMQNGHLADYVQFIPLAPGFGIDSLRVTVNSGRTFSEKWVDNAGAMSTLKPTHLVATFAQYDPRPNPDVFGYRHSVLTMYVDGALVGSVEFDDEVILRSMNDNNIWLGRSQFPDTLFRGSYDELRIYDSRLSAAEVAQSYALGPNAVPEPTALWLALPMGLCGAATRRRRAAIAR